MNVAWVYLLVAAVFEIMFAMSMKASDGFTRFWPSIATILGVIGGIGFLTLALRTLPVSVGYPAWVAAGVLGSVILGHLVFGESLSPLKLASAAVIILGVAGLKLASNQ